MYLLTQRWREPCDGSALHSLELTPAEADQFAVAIAWLCERGGSEIGNTLSEFELEPRPGWHGKTDVTGLNEAMELLARESRYEEDRTFYHETERHTGLEAACASPGHWL